MIMMMMMIMMIMMMIMISWSWITYTFTYWKSADMAFQIYATLPQFRRGATSGLHRTCKVCFFAEYLGLAIKDPKIPGLKLSMATYCMCGALRFKKSCDSCRTRPGWGWGSLRVDSNCGIKHQWWTVVKWWLNSLKKHITFMVAMHRKDSWNHRNLKELVLYGVRLGTSMNDVSIYMFFFKFLFSGWSLSWAPRKCQSQRVNFRNHILLHDIGILEKIPMIFIEHRCTEPFFSAFAGGSLYTWLVVSSFFFSIYWDFQRDRSTTNQFYINQLIPKIHQFIVGESNGVPRSWAGGWGQARPRKGGWKEVSNSLDDLETTASNIWPGQNSLGQHWLCVVPMLQWMLVDVQVAFGLVFHGFPWWLVVWVRDFTSRRKNGRLGVPHLHGVQGHLPPINHQSRSMDDDFHRMKRHSYPRLCRLYTSTAIVISLF